MLNKFVSVRSFCIIVLLLLVFPIAPAAAQSTAFTYQGKLSDNGNPANGLYDFQFSLWDAASGGGTIGEINLIAGVAVTNGIFTVTLDFGTLAFPGANRYLEIAVRPANTGSYTTLSPRQPILSTPYALNATQLGGLAASGFLQNSTSQQASSNFNISGNGTAGGTLTGSIINAVTQYNLNGLRALAVTGPYNDGTTIFTASNTFVGEAVGLNTTPDPSPAGFSGKFNSFFGAGAGQANSSGFSNVFFGDFAGNGNTTGDSNAFFGSQAGQANTSGFNNAFIGSNAGRVNSTGSDNSFFGKQAGYLNTIGSNNAFFGSQAGQLNTAGINNTFIGALANFNASNSTGNNNTLLGFNTRVTAGITNSAAIGALASVTQSNSLVLGGITGINGGTSVNVGIGTTAPTERLHVVGNGLITGNLTVNGTLNLPSFAGQFIQNSTTQQANANFNISGNGIVGGSLSVGNAGTSAQLYLNRASAIGANAADINFWSAGSPDFALGTSQGSAAPSDFSIYNYGTGSNALTISRSTGFIGIGTTSPSEELHVYGRAIFNVPGNNGFRITPQSDTDVGILNVTNAANTVNWLTVNANGQVIMNGSGNVGIGTSTPTAKLHVQGEAWIGSSLSVGYWPPGGSFQVCWAGSYLSSCGSSSRYKTNINEFYSGLSTIKKLIPITFDWKSDGKHDLGLVAEEVEKVDPLLVTYNKDGQVEGVKYDRVGVVLINAVKEQQAQIEKQQAQIESLRSANEALKQQNVVLQQHDAEIDTRLRAIERRLRPVARRQASAAARRRLAQERPSGRAWIGARQETSIIAAHASACRAGKKGGGK